MGLESWPNTWLAGGLGLDNHRRRRRFGASDNAGAATADKRLLRPLLRHISVSVNRVAPKKYAGVKLSGWARFGIAVLFIVIGRLVLKIEGRGTFLIDLSQCWREG